MENIKEWGAHGRYCAQEFLADRRVFSQKEKDIGNRLNKRFPDLKKRVEKSVKEANTQLREALRSETGLKLSNEKTRQNVPVRVADGIPECLMDVLKVDDDLLDLYLDLAIFKSAAKGIELLLPKYVYLEKWEPLAPSIASKDEFDNSRKSLVKLITGLESLNPFKEIWEINQDVLGTYFFRQGRIEIYWIPIGLIAADLDISPESLTQVVVAHELAHAYTHLGFDIDEQTWNTEHFAKTTLDVVEGVAQFFTEAVCRRLRYRWPDAIEAYDALLTKQTGPYKAHLDWNRGDDAVGEAVRNAMIQFRSSSIDKDQNFTDMISHYKELLGPREKQFGEPVEIYL